MYDRILIPTDGSKGAEAAVEHAAVIAEKFDAEVHIIYVVDVRVRTTSDLWANIMGEFRKIGENSTSQIAGRLDQKGLDEEVILIGGTPGKGGGMRRTVSKRTARMHKSGARYSSNAMTVLGDRNRGGKGNAGSGKKRPVQEDDRRRSPGTWRDRIYIQTA
ncbi:hypothetical protein HRED_09317 [Candidatus Haloredivivus sp. G17]|nr:hypothetical protein HRED_09317 [Candidatus Haloredivivus sp. G17]